MEGTIDFNRGTGIHPGTVNTDPRRRERVHDSREISDLFLSPFSVRVCGRRAGVGCAQGLTGVSFLLEVAVVT